MWTRGRKVHGELGRWDVCAGGREEKNRERSKGRGILQVRMVKMLIKEG